MMKKLIYIIPCLMLFLTSCDWFELDNYDSHDAKIQGTFKDSATGLPVPQEYYATSSGDYTGFLNVYNYENSDGRQWTATAAQRWYVKPDGTYQNDLIFSGLYKIVANQNNYYPETKDNLVINKGSNVVDFEVTPYVRIIDPVVTYDETAGKIRATFKLQLGDATKANTISQIRLCAYTDRFVGTNFNNCKSDPGAFKTSGVVADGTTTYTLEIDVNATANAAQFKYSRTHYIRIAACAKGGTYNTTGYFNLSQVFEIAL